LDLAQYGEIKLYRNPKGKIEGERFQAFANHLRDLTKCSSTVLSTIARRSIREAATIQAETAKQLDSNENLSQTIIDKEILPTYIKKEEDEGHKEELLSGEDMEIVSLIENEVINCNNMNRTSLVEEEIIPVVNKKEEDEEQKGEAAITEMDMEPLKNVTSSYKVRLRRAMEMPLIPQKSETKEEQTDEDPSVRLNTNLRNF
jgi:hypothetical protein